MGDFTGIVAEIRALKSQNEAAQDGAQKVKADLEAKLQELSDLCKPHCLAAVEHYNARASYKILSEHIALGFNLNTQELVLAVRLRTETGYEPDESYSFEEEKELTKRLGRLLDPLLAKAGIPLALSEIKVPLDYFPK